MTPRSLALDLDPHVPAGFVYRPDIVAPDQEQSLVADIRTLAFAEVTMRGQVARRRTVHLGWLYGYEGRAIEPGPPIPDFLLPLRERAAAVAGVAAEDLAEVLVTEYTPGAGIGWHRDAPMFGRVVGVSLLGACRLRFRRPASASPDRSAPAAGPPARSRRTAAWHTHEVLLEPRSAYLLRGSARWAWQHSIPPVSVLRYSITFRTVRVGGPEMAPHTPPRSERPGGPGALLGSPLLRGGVPRAHTSSGIPRRGAPRFAVASRGVT